ncbi:hypothetical protein P7K49_014757 [Saguinus oedipus]|uniref:Uncharacterized protein n=1 Tax=Saguinus oedipus TaxID=9490 RepID=A0ABQ9V7A1_SAGOE|nr:hypothetical protein P7K49_014757 [Saguinus oedipus]
MRAKGREEGGGDRGRVGRKRAADLERPRARIGKEGGARNGEAGAGGRPTGAGGGEEGGQRAEDGAAPVMARLLRLLRGLPLGVAPLRAMRGRDGDRGPGAGPGLGVAGPAAASGFPLHFTRCTRGLGPFQAGRCPPLPEPSAAHPRLRKWGPGAPDPYRGPQAGARGRGCSSRAPAPR